MVFDPVSAIGLAGTLVQLIDFGRKLLCESHQIHASPTGVSSRNEELENAAQTLLSLDGNVEHSLQSKGRATSANDQELRRLGQNCHLISLELLTTLDKLRVAGSKHRKWRSFQQAFKSVLSNDEINDLLRRMQESRQQLDSHMLACLRESVSDLCTQQSTLLSQVSHTHEYGGTQNHDRHYLRDKTSEELEEGRWKVNVLDAVYKSEWQIPLDANLNLLNASSCVINLEQFQKITLNQLWSDTIPDRHEKIAEAYQQTYSWIYHNPDKDEKPWTSFVAWLRYGNGIYWVTGKAGSGKSTLLKYLYDNPRTRECLTAWTGSLPLRIVGFFWSSGHEMQMSQVGLLRCLLYQLLKEEPHLIPRVFPQRWTSYNLFGKRFYSWGKNELLKAFRTAVAELESVSKIIFFIDGLDEYSGTHSELIDLFRDISSSANVKLCISSRPWLEFEDEFADNPRLVLQDLTYPDIKHFVVSKLCQSAKFVELQRRQPESASLLTTEIAERASGVFLWVNLVVHSLLQGLRNSDRMSDLQKRLRALPDDLEHLYERLFGDIEPAYFEHASQLFQIHRTAGGSLSLLDFSFADEENLDYALYGEIKPLSLTDQRFRCEEMMRRLISRCRGLLEVSSSAVTSYIKDLGSHYNPGVLDTSSKIETGSIDDSRSSSQSSPELFPVLSHLSSPLPTANEKEVDFEAMTGLTVDYLHRTARDFLESPKTWTRILNATGKSFNPHLSLACMYVSQLKTFAVATTDREESHSELQRAMLPTQLWNLVAPCLLHLREVGNNSLEETQRLLSDQLDLTIQHYQNIADFGTYLPAVAVKLGILPYIRNRLERGTFPFETHVGEPLLNITIIQHKRHRSLEGHLKTFMESWTRKNGYTLPDVAVIKLLLEHGADPNQLYEGSTPWLNLVQIAGSHEKSPVSQPDTCSDWLDIAELFLQHGADPTIWMDVAIMGPLHNALRRSEPVRVAKLDAIAKAYIKGQNKARSHRLLRLQIGTPLR